MIQRNLKIVEERVPIRVNAYEDEAIRYFLTPTDMHLLFSFQVKSNLAWLALCIWQPADTILVPCVSVELFDDLLKELGIGFLTEKQWSMLQKRHRQRDLDKIKEISGE